MKNSHYIVFDCETGGLSETSNHMTQVACLVLDSNTLKEIDRFETFVKPYNDLKIEQRALESSLVKMSDINNGMPIDKVVKTLAAFFKMYSKPKGGEPILVGHNIGFDTKFLDYAFNLHGLHLYSSIQRISADTLMLAKMLWLHEANKEDKVMKLWKCCERAGIVLKDAHGAMNDVIATAQLFVWFIHKLRSNKGDEEMKPNAQKAREFFEF